MQSAGLAGIDRLAGNAMYPQSQQINTQFATPSQMPTSAEVVRSDYDAVTNPYTGEPVRGFAEGGDVEGLQQLESSPEPVDYKAQIDQLYQGILGRSPDADAEGWEKLLNVGYGIDEVARQIGATQEAKNKAISEIPEELRANDPKNFAGSITQLYASALGRTPDAAALEANINLLNSDPDAFGMLANSVINSPEAKAYAEKSGIDLDSAYANVVGNYEHFTPTVQKLSGFHGLLQKAGPYMPYAAAALMTAGATGGLDALAASGASGAGTGAGSLDAYMKAAGLNPGTFSASALPSTTTAGMTALDAGTQAAINAAAAPTYSTTALPYGITSVTPTAAGSTVIPEAITIGAAGGGGAAATTGITAKQAAAAKMGLNLLTSGIGGQQPTGYAASTPMASAPATMPTVNRFGVTGYEGQLPTAEVAQRPILLSKIKGIGGDYTFAEGGIAALGSYSDGGQLLKGPGDGMSDNIPAKIGEVQPARLADGEFVVPADVVSHLGNGSTDAGAKQLYAMMDKIRKARTGNKKQGKQINPSKFLPKG
jgi:hypothetical protein